MMREGGRNIPVSEVVTMCPAVASELLLTTELLMRTADEMVHYGAEDLIYSTSILISIFRGNRWRELRKIMVEQNVLL